MIELEKATNGGEKATVEALNANTFAFKQKLGGSKVIIHSKFVAEQAHQEGMHAPTECTVHSRKRRNYKMLEHQRTPSEKETCL